MGHAPRHHNDGAGDPELELEPIQQSLATINTIVSAMGWSAVDDAESKDVSSYMHTAHSRTASCTMRAMHICIVQ